MKRICTVCGEELMDGAKFCTNCGCEYKEQKICPNCNTPIKDGAKFCTQCGYSLEKPEKKKRNIYKFIAGILVVACIFVLPSIIAVPLLIVWGVITVLKKMGKWENMNKGIRIGGAVVLALVCWIIVGGGYGSKNVIECENSPYKAAYNFNFEETIEIVNGIFSEYYGEEIDIEEDFLLNESSLNYNVTSYVFYDEERGIATELGFTEDGKLCLFTAQMPEYQVLKESAENYDSLYVEDMTKATSAEVLFCMMVNELTDDTIETDEIDRILDSKYKGKIWVRNNNSYLIGLMKEGVVCYGATADLISDN